MNNYFYNLQVVLKRKKINGFKADIFFKNRLNIKLNECINLNFKSIPAEIFLVGK